MGESIDHRLTRNVDFKGVSADFALRLKMNQRDSDFENRVYMVTGSTQGVGEAIATSLASHIATISGL